MTEALAVAGSATRATVIAARAVFKSYRDEGLSVDVLRGVDLEVRKGEVLAVVGASGSGKSTCCIAWAASIASIPVRS